MARSIVVGALGVLTLGAGLNAQEPPPLEAPSLTTADNTPTPPHAERPREAQGDADVDAKPAPAEPPVRPLLVIPGVTAPLPRTARKPAAAESVKTPERAAPPPLGGSAAVVDLGPSIPLRLERIEPEVVDDLNQDLDLEPAPAPAPTATRAPARAAAPAAGEPRAGESPREPRTTPKPTTSAAGEASTPPANAASRRPSTPFSRLLGAGDAAGGRDELSVESTGDPAVEAAVKRRVQKQIQDALGDRVKDVEVRVMGRSIIIRARATRFWYRWNVRRALDALQMPAGYRSHAQLLD